MIINLVDDDYDLYKSVVIEDYPINPMTLRFLKDLKDDEEVTKELDKLLSHDLDTSIITNIGKSTSVNTPKYNRSLSLYIYYWRKIENHILSNEYLNKLKYRMIENIKFDNEYNKSLPVNEKHITKKRKTNHKQIWAKEESKDLFTNEIVYIYTNNKTGEIIKSNNPNLFTKVKTSKTIKKKTKGKLPKFSFKLYINL